MSNEITLETASQVAPTNTGSFAKSSVSKRRRQSQIETNSVRKHHLAKAKVGTELTLDVTHAKGPQDILSPKGAKKVIKQKQTTKKSQLGQLYT